MKNKEKYNLYDLSYFQGMDYSCIKFDGQEIAEFKGMDDREFMYAVLDWLEQECKESIVLTK